MYRFTKLDRENSFLILVLLIIKNGKSASDQIEDEFWREMYGNGTVEMHFTHIIINILL